MKFFTQLVKKFSPVLWTYKLFGKDLVYYGGDIEVFQLEFERLEDQVIQLWDNNKLTWGEYQQYISEIQKAKQQFAWFAY